MALAAMMLAGCGTSSTVPITGRKQNILVSDEQVLSLSNQQYQEYMNSAKVSTNATNTAMVKRCGQRLANAVVSYLQQNGMAQEVANYKWEFNLVQDNSVNAFCMPGGKIVVYEGLLPVTKDEASLAVVLGHEIAHAVAKHSAERMSNEIRKQYGGQILGAVLQGTGASANLRASARLCLDLDRLWVGLLIHVARKTRPTISASSLLPWLDMTQWWLSTSGNVWLPLPVTLTLCSATTQAMKAE